MRRQRGTPFDLSSLTLQPASSFPEFYYPIWMYSGSYASFSAYNSLGHGFIGKGTTGYVGSTSTSAQLFTVNPNANPNTQYALEAALGNSSSNGVGLQLWDITTGALLSGGASYISIGNGSTSLQVIRSSKFALTPGHSYAVSIMTGNTTTTAYATDISLIVFPSSPLVSQSVSSISLSNPSGNTVKEAYIPLWVCSSSATNALTTIPHLIQKGSQNGVATSSTTNASKLYTLSSSWSVSQKFALESSFYISNASTTANVELWDITSGTAVSGSLISTSSSTATLIRSGSFTLTPTHTYGVAYYSGASGYAPYITKAHLVALAN